VRDAQRLALKYGAKPDAWEGNVEKYLSLKSEPRYYNDSAATLGYCNGQLAVLYTRNIIERYRLYREVIPK
jgi:membrane-bound lytic murein transglycosylase F